MTSTSRREFVDRPVGLRDGLATISPVTPGQRMALAPPCWPMAHRLPAGHRLVLRFQTSDPDALPFGPLDLVTIFTGELPPPE